MNAVSSFSSSSGYCMDDEFRLHLFGKAVRYFMQGIAAALLMPIEMLECLRRGHRSNRHTWFSWLFSVAICISGCEIWTLAHEAVLDGHDRTGIIFCYCLGLFLAGVISGRLQANGGSRALAYREEAYVNTLRYSHHGRDHRGHHHGHTHSEIAPRLGTENKGYSSAPLQKVAVSGICYGDCRQCQESICVKTGLAKRGKTK
jgi:hypothetical protein